MRVLITGDRGYLGAVFAPMLQAAGHDVVGLDTGWYAGCDFGAQVGGYEQRVGDVRAVSVADLNGFDAVVHLAEVAHDPVGYLKPSAMFSVNTDGTVCVARAAKAAGVPRFLFASSCSLYGAAGSSPVDETSRIHPMTPYGESKVQAERALSVLADDSFSPTYLRTVTPYGSSPRLRTDVLVNNLVGAALLGRPVRLPSDGSRWCSLVHASDIGRAVIAALEAPRETVHDEAFNVGRDEDVVQLRTVAQEVAQRTGTRVLFAPGAGPGSRTRRVSFAKIGARLPAFRPTWTLAAGIDELTAGMQRIGWAENDFHRSCFVRLARVKELMADGLLDAQLRAVVPADRVS
jgi:nucleoside-diphosphate-sugar epimerase